MESMSINILCNAEKQQPPQYFICPLSKQIMSKPVRTPNGLVFERDVIFNWYKTISHSCPLTMIPLKLTDLVHDSNLEREIQEWQKRYATPSETGVSLPNKDLKQSNSNIKVKLTDVYFAKEVSDEICPPSEDLGVRNEGSPRWSLLGRKRLYYAPLA